MEGIASSVALTERLQQSSLEEDNIKDRSILAHLPDTHPVWDHAANAIANLCVTLILLLSMEEIVLGGGIMKRTILYEKIQTRTEELLNGYVSVKDNNTDSEIMALRKTIRTPTWGDSTGLVGALMLAKMAYEHEKRE